MWFNSLTLVFTGSAKRTSRLTANPAQPFLIPGTGAGPEDETFLWPLRVNQEHILGDG